jgi:hypothetical protein
LRLLGQPESADDYQIATGDEQIAVDPIINERLHDAGFTQEQAQLVYDLAGERLAPLVDQARAEVESAHQVERLTAQFGGSEKWSELSRQIKTWGQANLSGEVFTTLSTNYDGVLAMHRMMQADEPEMLRRHGDANGVVDESSLRNMMRDPRYWRDRDPAYVAQVTDGYKRIYTS